MIDQPKQNKSGLAAIAVLFVFCALTIWGVANRQAIVDFVRAQQFTPSSSIAQIADDLQMTDSAHQLFLASQPRLEPASSFNTNCNQQAETNNPILGCYAMQNIYIFDVTNQKLNGIEQTTAAHELLHAVYERLNESERRSIDKELQQAYQQVKDDDLISRMEFYEKTEPGEQANELHSILGTEFENLGPVLEDHYKKYFKNRSVVVAYNKQYSSVFNDIAARLKTLENQINNDVASINQRISTHNQAVKQLEADQSAFIAKNRRGGFSSIADFNATQQELNRRATQLNSERDEIAQAIERSNRMRDDYNALAKEYNELNKSINSSIAPSPSI